MAVGPDYRVSKIVLHTNAVEHPHFGFYNQCAFQMPVEERGVITPNSTLAEVEELLGKRKDEKFFVHNVTAEFVTHFHAFPSAIFEFSASTGVMVSITLFK